MKAADEKYGKYSGENFRIFTEKQNRAWMRKYSGWKFKFIIVQNEDRRSGYSQEENPRTYNNRMRQKKRIQPGGESREGDIYQNQNEDGRSGVQSGRGKSSLQRIPRMKTGSYIQDDARSMQKQHTPAGQQPTKANGILRVLQDGYGFIAVKVSSGREWYLTCFSNWSRI